MERAKAQGPEAVPDIEPASALAFVAIRHWLNLSSLRRRNRAEFAPNARHVDDGTSVSPWAWLLTAATAEVAWSQSIKPTDGFTRILPTLLCFVLGVSAVYPLTRAMQGIPVGTAYTVFTGIGATGAVVLGVMLYGDPITVLRLTGITLVVTGVIALRASGG
jgi:quaternary ammonium compound-resistance protein SugE